MKSEQFLTASLKANPRGDDITRILAAAIQAVDPYRAVQNHLRIVRDQLHAGRQTYNLRKYRRIFLVGAGKAGLPMAEAVVDILGSRITDGLVIVKDGYGGPGHVGTVQIREAAHPVPDERGLTATREILDLIAEADDRDLVLAVISGGGSALLTAPEEGISLEDIQQLTRLLLSCGASILEINQIRKRLDRVKGGGLVKAGPDVHISALILSDVVGDPLDLIASGPTVLEANPRQKPFTILEEYGLQDQVPEAVRRMLRRPPDPPFVPHPPENTLVGNNEIAARAALDQAERLGFQTELLTTTLTGEARQVGLEYGQMLRVLASGDEPVSRPSVWIAGGETTVTLQGGGLGGRNQELALAAVPAMDGLEDAALITLATDGGDGPTGAAGAVVTGETARRGRNLGLDHAALLADNDSHTYFRQLEDCLTPGPTRTNVNDLLFLYLL